MFIRGDCLKLVGIFWLMLLTTLSLLPNKYPTTLPVGSAIVQMVFQRKSKMDLNRQKQKQNVQRIVKSVKSSQSSKSVISGYFLFFWKLLLHNIRYCRLGKVYRHHWDAQTGNLILSLTFRFQHWAWNIVITPSRHPYIMLKATPGQVTKNHWMNFKSFGETWQLNTPLCPQHCTLYNLLCYTLITGIGNYQLP